MGVKLPILCAVVVCGLAPARAQKADVRQAYEKARASYFALKDSAERQKFRHNWLRVIAGFEELAAAHPKTQEAAAAIYTAAELWSDLWSLSRRESDLDQALTNYERVVHTYPTSSLADDALWQRSQIYMKRLNNRAAAARAAREILERYPDGDMKGRAEQLAGELADVPAEAPAKELEAVDSPMVGRREGAGVPEVTDLRHWSNPTYTRVVVYLDGPAVARSGSAPADPVAARPERLFVDLKKAKLSKKVAAAHVFEDDLLAQVRLGQYTQDTVRIVLDLKQPAEERLMVMENPFRVVIDAVVPVATATTPVKDAQPVALRGRKVAIDAGHGGKDGGAKGPGKLLEKQVTLAIAQEVRRLLVKEGVEVLMTRDADRYVGLEERTALANRESCDLFVSIHANSNKSKKVRGVETYYLDVTDDAYALRLAAIENQTSEEQASDLQLILADMATKAFTQQSSALAGAIQRKLVSVAGKRSAQARDLGAKPSLFYVLLGARMPAVLVETGFLSHAQEGKLLGEPGYQKELAAAIAAAVLETLRADGSKSF